jgi:hypothetical protein
MKLALILLTAVLLAPLGTLSASDLAPVTGDLGSQD